MQKYGEKLREIRKNKGLTQAQAAEMIGLPQQSWQRLEKGTLDPRMTTIYTICKTFGISADWLLGLNDGDCTAH